SISGNGMINGPTAGQSVSVDADGGGSFTLTLTVTGANGCSSTCTKIVTVNSPPQISSNPTDNRVCATHSVSFTAAASGSPTPGIQWQLSTDGGSTFVNISGATSATYTFTAGLTDNGKQFRALFSNVCGPATSTAATLSVDPLPACSITGADTVCASSTAVYSGPVGVGYTYSWSVANTGGANASISGANNGQSVTINTGTGAGTATLTLTVTAAGCSSACTKPVTVAVGGVIFEGWKNSPAASVSWQTGLSQNDAAYAEGGTVPFRLTLPQPCVDGTWSITIQYDFVDNTGVHFFDFLTTYNASESTVTGQKCDA